VVGAKDRAHYLHKDTAKTSERGLVSCFPTVSRDPARVPNIRPERNLPFRLRAGVYSVNRRQPLEAVYRDAEAVEN
jgi:hypothetical protein